MAAQAAGSKRITHGHQPATAARHQRPLPWIPFAAFAAVVAIRQSGLTHYRLGKDAGVAPAQLDRFVAGERDLTLTTAAKVARALGLVLVSRG